MTPAEERRAFGSGLRLQDGDLVLERGEDGMRLAEVEGREALLQALQLRVLTPYASDRFNVLYGVDYAQIFGSGEGPPMMRELVKLNLVRALATDARVIEVQEIAFAEEDASRVSRVWQVEVSLQTSAAVGVTLALGIGG